MERVTLFARHKWQEITKKSDDDNNNDWFKNSSRMSMRTNQRKKMRPPGNKHGAMDIASYIDKASEREKHAVANNRQLNHKTEHRVQQEYTIYSDEKSESQSIQHNTR